MSHHLSSRDANAAASTLKRFADRMRQEPPQDGESIKDIMDYAARLDRVANALVEGGEIHVPESGMTLTPPTRYIN